MGLGPTCGQNFSFREVDVEIPGSIAGAITRTRVSHKNQVLFFSAINPI